MKNNIAQVLMMSKVQQGILFQSLSQKEPIYDEIVCFKLRKHVEAGKVKESWNHVLEHNIILKSIAKWERMEKPVLVVMKEKEVNFRNIITEESIDVILENEKEEKIDIQKDAIKIILVTESNGEQYMILHSHHLFLDGWSTNLVIEEFEQCFKGKECKKVLTYKDYLQYLRSIDNKGGIEYWKKQGKEAVFHMFLPYTHNTINCKKNYEGIISRELTEKLNHFKNDKHITLSTFFYAAWSLFLFQYNQCADFGVTNSGRYCSDKNFEQVVGLFISTYLFHIKPQKNQKLEEFYKHVNRIHLESLNYQHISIIDLQDMFSDKMKEMNTLIVVENYPVKVDSDLLRLHKVIENTHYDIVCQIYIEDCIRMKLITNPAKNIDLKKIYKDYYNIILKMLSATSNSKIEEILDNRKCEVSTISSFEMKPLALYWNEWGRRNNLHVMTKAIDIRNLAFERILKNQHIVLFLALEFLVEGQSGKMAEKIANDVLVNIRKMLQENQESEIQIYGMKNMIPWKVSSELETMFEQIYAKFIEGIRTYKNIRYYDLVEMYTRQEAEDAYDFYSYREANIPYSLDFYLDLSKKVFRNINVKYANEYKVIVLDCDHTLWKGIAEETGVENIEISQAYMDFQKFLLKKKQEGFLLALCSKNEEKTVREVFAQKTEMPLSLDDFVTLKVNWKNKSENIREIANELNLGLSSFIFIDDSIWECSEVMRNFPEVFSILMPENEEDIMPFILSIWAFDKKLITEEDKNRTLFYKQQLSREEVKKQAENQNEYLKKLKLEIRFCNINEFNLSRVSQLSYRTNQFNLNGEKLDEQNILDSIAKKKKTFSICVKDQFGSYGIVGYLEGSIAETKVFSVTRFYLSCRVLGRKVEEAILQYLFSAEFMSGIDSIQFMLVDTGKNSYIFKFLNKVAEIMNHDGKYIIFKVRRGSFWNPKLLKHIVCLEETYMEQQEKQVQEIEKTELLEIDSDINKKEIIINQNYIQALRNQNELGKIEPVLIHTEKEFLYATQEKEEHVKIPDDVLLSETYKKVYEIWSEVLQTEKIGDFFSLGGHSLKAMTLAAKLSKKLNQNISVADILKYTKFEKLVQHITQGSEKENITIPHRTGKQFPIPNFESHIYAMQQVCDGTVLNMPFLFQISGKLDVKQLENNIKKIISNNRILTAAFQGNKDNPVLVLQDNIEFEVEQVMLEKIPDTIYFTSLIKPFDITEAPLLRVVDIQNTINQERYLLIDFHHLLMDGQSLGIFIEQLNALYAGKSAVQTTDYLDYAEWFQKKYVEHVLEQQRSYWINELKDSNFGFRVPAEVSRGNRMDYTGEAVYFQLDKEMTDLIKQLSQQFNASEFCTLFAIYCIYVYRITSERSFNIGVPVSLRDQDAVFHTIGMMVNTLVIRVEIDTEDTFESFVQKIATKIANGIENKEFMLQDLLSSMKAENREIESLFDIMFVFQNFELPEIKIPNVKMKHMHLMNPVAQNALILEVIATSEGYNCNFTFHKDRLKKEWIPYKIQSFMTLCRSILQNSTRKIGTYPLMDKEMIYQVKMFGEGRAVHVPESTLFKNFYQVVQSRGKSCCVIYQDRNYSYEEIYNMVLGMAEKIKRHGIKQGDVVAVYCDNAFHVAVGILAVFFVNAVYLPLAKDTPYDRMLKILKESSAALILCSKESGLPKEYSKCNFDIQNSKAKEQSYSGYMDDLAYIIYTSGTTGQSKGVKIRHSAIANAINWRVREYQFTPQDTSILLLGFTFDGFMTAFFTPLLSGAPIVLMDNVLDTQAVYEQIIKYKVTNMILTPTMYNMLLERIEESREVNHLGKITLAGEALMPSLVSRSKKILPEVELINEYGPTENSVVSTYKRDVNENNISIGSSIDNCQVRIVDEQGMDCPIGCQGELWLSGAGLSSGYLGDEELTNKKFVREDSGEIWYHTGDLACWLENGEISIFNRKDQQIKVHGYRIDLSEIEKNILTMTKVKNCLVAVHNKECIVCYYISEQFIPVIEFIEIVREKLPKYMIPHEYVRVSCIPTKSSGKVDMKEVEKYALLDSSKKVLDCKICAEVTTCYENVLNKKEIGLQENFFAIGGNSIRAVSLQEMLNSVFTLNLSVVDIFTYPTIELLTEYIMACKSTSEKALGDIPYKKEYVRQGVNQKKMRSVEDPISEIGMKNLKDLAERSTSEESIVFMALVLFFMQDYIEEKNVKCIFEYKETLYRIQYDIAIDMEFYDYVADLKSQIKAENVISEGDDIELPMYSTLISYDYSEYRETCMQNIVCYVKSYNKTQKSLCIKYNSGLLDETVATGIVSDVVGFLEQYEEE